MKNEDADGVRALTGLKGVRAQYLLGCYVQTCARMDDVVMSSPSFREAYDDVVF